MQGRDNLAYRVQVVVVVGNIVPGPGTPRRSGASWPPLQRSRLRYARCLVYVHASTKHHIHLSDSWRGERRHESNGRWRELPVERQGDVQVWLNSCSGTVSHGKPDCVCSSFNEGRLGYYGGIREQARFHCHRHAVPLRCASDSARYHSQVWFCSRWYCHRSEWRSFQHRG